MAKRKAGYSIGAVAQMLDIHPQTLRIYEREGLVKPHRSSGNTRIYTDEDIKKIELIQSAKCKQEEATMMKKKEEKKKKKKKKRQMQKKREQKQKQKQKQKKNKSSSGKRKRVEIGRASCRERV